MGLAALGVPIALSLSGGSESAPQPSASSTLPFFDSWKSHPEGGEGAPSHRREEHPGERSRKPLGNGGSSEPRSASPLPCPLFEFFWREAGAD